MAQSVFIYGPAACGKTTNAEELRKYFGLDRIIDEYTLYRKKSSHHISTEGDLILSESKTYAPAGVRVLSFDEAMALGQITPKYPKRGDA